MRFSYGSYEHPDNECMVTFWGGSTIYNARGKPQYLRKRMVVEGEIVANGSTAIAARVKEIQDAYAVPGGSATLHGTAGAYTLSSAGSVSGVRIVQAPTFFQQDGKAHMATGLPFSVVLEADYLINDGDPLVSYSETITHIGTGGPRRATLELDNGEPIEQIVSTHTPVTIIQAGEAVGSAGYPSINQPIFPTQVDLPDGLQISTSAPRLEGNVYVDWPIRWAYRMTCLNLPSIPYPLQR